MILGPVMSQFDTVFQKFLK